MSQNDQLIPGLESPGPIYVLPGGFDKAGTKSKHPTWGHHEAPSLKSGRYRTDEVRFSSHRHMREMQGHFSPGPQYSLPGTIGGTMGNATAASERVRSVSISNNSRDLASTAMPYTNSFAGGASGSTVKLSATQLGGDSNYTLTRGSFADAERVGGSAPLDCTTEYWRSATMLRETEPNFHNSGPNPGLRQPWHLSHAQATNTQAQETIKQGLRERYREEPKLPRRQVTDFRSDPPLANVFGSGQAHTDHGVIGGVDREWRESKVQGYSTSAARMGPSTGPLRYAFVQPSGPNSVPRGTGKADFTGGRKSLLLADGTMPRGTMPR